MERKLTVDLEKVLVTPTSILRDVITCLDQNSCGIALVVDDNRRLLDAVTDKEIRRAVLAGHDLGAPVTDLLNYKSPQEQQIVTAHERMDDLALMQLMQERKVQYLPIMDDKNRVVDLILLHDLFQLNQLPIIAVVHAQSLGMALHQAGSTMRPAIVNFPILEWLIKDLSRSGITTLIVLSDFMPEAVHLTPSKGEGVPLEMEYLKEEQSLGPAGTLGLIKDWKEGLLYIGGNILTLTDFRAMFKFHQQEIGDATVAVCEYHLKKPETYGFFQLEENASISQVQTPLHINTGIYLFSSSIRQFITKDGYLNIPTLAQRLIDSHRKVVAFSIGEYWIDTEQLARYEQALKRD